MALALANEIPCVAPVATVMVRLLTYPLLAVRRYKFVPLPVLHECSLSHLPVITLHRVPFNVAARDELARRNVTLFPFLDDHVLVAQALRTGQV